jgi:uncharacterized protein (TIGR03066 family)
MKTKHHLPSLALLLFCLLTIGACNRPPAPQAPPPTIVGTWGISQALGYTAFTFSADGTLLVTQKTSVFDAQKTNGTWKLEGSKLTVTMGSHAPEINEVVSLQPKLLRLKVANGTVTDLRKVKSMGQFGEISFE